MRLRSLPFKDVRNIAMSLVIAIAVWVYAHSSSLATKSSAVRFDIVAKSGWVVTSVREPSGREMPVTIVEAASTPGQDTRVFSVFVEADIQYPRRADDVVQEAIRGGKVFGETTIEPPGEDEEREIRIPLFPADFRTPSGLGATVVKVMTGWLEVTIAQEDTRLDVPVEAVVVGAPPGARVDSKYPSPDRVVVTGPRSVVARLDRIRTEPIDLKGTLKDTDVRFGVPIPVSAKINDKVMVDGVERRVRCNTAVECIIYLAPQLIEREFADVPVRLLTEPDFQDEVKFVSSQKFSVRVSGSPSAVSGLNAKDILLFVDISSMERTPGRQYLDVIWKIRNVPAGETISVRPPEQVGVELTPRSPARP